MRNSVLTPKFCGYLHLTLIRSGVGLWLSGDVRNSCKRGVTMNETKEKRGIERGLPY